MQRSRHRSPTRGDPEEALLGRQTASTFLAVVRTRRCLSRTRCAEGATGCAADFGSSPVYDASMSTVLIVEDDEGTRAYLEQLLVISGWSVIHRSTGAGGLAAYRSRRPDLVLLDLGLPDMSGLRVIEELRSLGDTPVVFLSGTSRQVSRVDALDAGADDFVSKPFRAAELTARLRAVVRRSAASAPGASTRQFGDLVIDTSSMTAHLRRVEVRLTATEWRLLEALSRRPGRVVTHRWLVRQVWSTDHGPEATGSLRAHVRSLRRKLGDDASEPHLLRTESGIGYRWIGEQDHGQQGNGVGGHDAAPRDPAWSPRGPDDVDRVLQQLVAAAGSSTLGDDEEARLLRLLREALRVVRPDPPTDVP